MVKRHYNDGLTKQELLGSRTKDLAGHGTELTQYFDITCSRQWVEPRHLEHCKVITRLFFRGTDAVVLRDFRVVRAIGAFALLAIERAGERMLKRDAVVAHAIAVWHTVG